MSSRGPYRPRKKRNDFEHKTQSAYFDFLSYHLENRPELDYIFAVPNGGARSITTAAKLKREGVKKGVLDVFIPIRGKNGEPGAFGEFKFGDNVMSAEQRRFRAFVETQGYKCFLWYTWQRAAEETFDYIGLECPKII